jgi:5-methylcytosine-specific restriction endonuclease McrA
MPPQDTTPAKRCSKCGETKPLDQFNKDRTGKAGHSAACRTCHAAAGRRYTMEHREERRSARVRYYAAHRAEALAKTAAYRQQHPERAKAAKAKCYWAKHHEYLAKKRAYRKANRDRINAERAAKNRQNPVPARQRAGAWYKANPERAAEQRRQYRRANSDKHLEANRKRRACKLGAPILTLDYAQWALILDYFGRACAYCGATGVALTQDHIVPLSRGGEHSATNVVPACRHCNSRKFARPLWRFLMERGHEH